MHNVPFKWCNEDLEALFRQLPGYLDAQLLFHENGRSKVGGGAFARQLCTWHVLPSRPVVQITTPSATTATA